MKMRTFRRELWSTKFGPRTYGNGNSDRRHPRGCGRYLLGKAGRVAVNGMKSEEILILSMEPAVGFASDGAENLIVTHDFLERSVF